MESNTGWVKEGYSCKWFLFTICCVERTCITRNEEFQFVYLTKAVLKTLPNAIFDMKKVENKSLIIPETNSTQTISKPLQKK